MTMKLKQVRVVFDLLITWFVLSSAGKHSLVAYWGQNSSGMKFQENPEKALKDVCQERKYDIILIGFVVKFFDDNQNDKLPKVDFAHHCKGQPNLQKCPEIEEGIRVCQAAGKKVLISLGGATATNYLNNIQGENLAKNIWDLFLGGQAMPSLRPFGSAILDGVNLDIHDGNSGGYSHLVRTLREVEKTAGVRKYLITGSPQCPYPDGALGPKPGSALGDLGEEFDHLYVQFYNNYCHTGNKANFDSAMNRWLQFAATKLVAKGKGPKIYVGIPSTPGASLNPTGYRTPEEVAEIYEKLNGRPNFGGFMLWDAAWDQQNVIDGRLYSDHIADILSKGGPVLPPTSQGGASTNPLSIPSPGETTTPGEPPAAGGSVSADFCKGKEDGFYADPSDSSGYITCSGGQMFKRSCPPGQVWNPQTQACDWPQFHDTKANQQPLRADNARHKLHYKPAQP